MFWNFVSTDKAKIKEASEQWEALDRSKFPEVVNEANTDSIPVPGTYRM